ncbi:hypothetical protein [Variovorax sp. Root434]|uniref:hypothetical protein n=1 Tax=Variovorax sp. Root434 TaxID=1736536 RepID=UPI0012FBC454|nr:hypothetical protein [Variovorax sp. Root434]
MNGGLFDACMNSKGWTLTRVQTGPDGVPLPPSSPLAETGKALQAASEAMCAGPAMQRMMQKSACQAKEITLEQLADESFLAAQDKALFSAWRAEVAGFNSKWLAAMRAHSGTKGMGIATSAEGASARLDQASLALYIGKITWGPVQPAAQRGSAHSSGGSIKDPCRALKPTVRSLYPNKDAGRSR